MSRFLITCWPFVGHVHPQLAVASALRDRGHEVAFYSGASARATVEGAGFELFGFQHVDEDAAFRDVTSLETGARPGRPAPQLLRRVFRSWLVETIPGQVEDLRAVMASWRPDVLVSDLALWAPIAVLWEAAPIPVALSSTFMGPLIPGPDAPPPGLGLRPPRTHVARAAAAAAHRLTDVAATGLRRRLDELRAEHGLHPMGCSMNAFTGRLPLYLVGNVPELDYDRRDLPPSVQYVGPCQWHPPANGGNAGWLEAVPRRQPWVHVTESTLRHGDPFLLRAAAQGLAGRPVQAILTTGRQREPQDLALGAPAANVHVTQWLNHDELLPRCAAVVTTGGPATIISSLQAGVPLVVVPTTWDKPDNARRVVEAGVGVRISPRRLTSDSLRAAVERVISEPRYRNAAQRAASRLAAAPGPPRAAELLEALAPAHRPPGVEAPAGGTAR